MKKISFLFPMLLLFSNSFAQDVESQKREIEYLRQMPGAVDKVLSTIASSSFGPFYMEGKCGYDSHWYCFGDCRTMTWSWNFPNFTWLKDALTGRFNEISTTARSFDNYFEPVRNWMLTSLPQFLEIYRQQQQAIKEYQSAFSAHAGMPEEQAKDRANIIQCIQKLNQALQNAQGQITQGIGNLSAFDRRMNNDLAQVSNLRQSMESSIASNQQRVWEITEKYQCDRDFARNKAVDIQNTVRARFNNVVANADAFGLNAAKVDASSSIIIADLAIIQNKYQGALGALEKAGSSPNAVIQNLQLEITYKFYSDLAAFAREQFR